ncbi:tetratricopeptide repeat-containing sensor histidine kinase [Taibaiella helva]|uniref:tetratricopeptide repeat-containing sensor histidine kinase n=1 Tax=Taibaiella helva TaxID=2301235 RepID=UPI000E567EE9|nr:sensor histidine kinase [Taibaiella helva]
MKKICIWLLVQCYATGLIAQDNAVTDSLARLLSVTQTDSGKAMLFYQLGDEWSYLDRQKALQYLKAGMELAKPFPLYEGIGHFYHGRILMNYARPQAIEAFDKALRLFEPITSKTSYLYQSRTWANKAAIAQWNNDNQRFITLNLEKAIPLAAKGGDSIRVAEDFSNIGLPFMDFGEYTKAIFYLNKSIAIFRRHAPQELRQGDNFCRIAQAYIYQNALSYTRINLDSAYSILRRHPQSIYMTNYHMVESQYYIHMKNWKKAEENIDAGLAIAERMNSRYDIRSLLYQKVRLYDKKNKPAAAKQILMKMLKEGYVDQDRDKKQIYHDLGYLESELGNMKAAYDWMVKYGDFADSFYQKDTRLKIADLERRYNYARKEKELIAATSKVKRQRLIISTGLLAVLILVLIFFLLYRLRKAKEKQEIQALQQRQQVAVTQALLTGEEKERTRLARDLHDGLGGMLAAVKINLTNVLQENTSAEAQRVVMQLDHSVAELRRIARNMMPEALLRSGLQVALSDLCQSVSSSHLHVESSLMNLSRNIPMQAQIIIYRIVQELLANVVRHSGATDAFVQCSQNNNVFFITVEDNGKGFDRLNINFSGGLGMENIKSRVDFLRGKIDIHSEPDKGTIINIELNTDGKG